MSDGVDQHKHNLVAMKDYTDHIAMEDAIGEALKEYVAKHPNHTIVGVRVGDFGPDLDARTPRFHIDVVVRT